MILSFGGLVMFMTRLGIIGIVPSGSIIVGDGIALLGGDTALFILPLCPITSTATTTTMHLVLPLSMPTHGVRLGMENIETGSNPHEMHTAQTTEGERDQQPVQGIFREVIARPLLAIQHVRIVFSQVREKPMVEDMYPILYVKEDG